MKIRLLAASLAFAMFGGMTAACGQGSEAGMASSTKLKTEIDARLPKGSSAGDVEAWLISKGLEHSGLIDNAGLAHMGGDPNTYEIKSLIAGPKRLALVHTDTQLTFTFDRDRKLIAARVEPVQTGM